MILIPEVRALLKRMDADDAIDRAAQLGWNAAIEKAASTCEDSKIVTAGGYHGDYDCGQETLDVAAEAIRALKDSK